MARAHFRTERMFYQSDLTGKAGWYFQAREGRIFGPYDSRHVADHALQIFVADCITTKDNGGRKANTAMSA